MNANRTSVMKILLPAVAVILIAVFVFRGKDDDSARKDDPRRMEKITNIFQFMTFEPDDETTLPLDPSKIDGYEIEEEKFIKNVIVEKDPVCAGEDFMVTVEASNPNGPDSNLVVRIGSKPGNPAIMSFNRAGEREFYVVVRDEGKRIQYKSVKVQVRDCTDRPSVFLKSSLHGTRPETAEFEVTNIQGLTGPLTFDWDFGDGKRNRTTTGYMTHNYGLREQEKFLSTFLAKVTVTDSKKTRVEGRTTISFPNIHFVSKMMGSPIIPVMYDRFPEFNGGRYEVAVTMKNIFEEAVVFDEALVEYRPCDFTGHPVIRSVSAGSLLSAVQLPAKSTVNDRLVFSRSELPKGTCSIIVKLTGKMGRDMPVTAGIYLDIPPRSGDSVASDDSGKGDRVVEDKEMQEKLNKAAEILGRGRPITPDEIKRLEKEGKL